MMGEFFLLELCIVKLFIDSISDIGVGRGSWLQDLQQGFSFKPWKLGFLHRNTV